MSRRLACVACRQNKVKCNTAETFPLPCERCSSRQIECKADPKYKRVPTRKRLEELTKELDILRRNNANATPGEALVVDVNSHGKKPTTPSSSSCTSALGPCATADAPQIVSMPVENVSPSRVFTLAQASFEYEEVHELFRIFFQHYHEHLPVLDVATDPISTFSASPFLFWTIVFIVGMKIPAFQSRISDSSAFCDMITKALFSYHTEPLTTMEALLILSAWSLPVRSQVEDRRWVYNGVVMQIALQNGLHQIKVDQVSPQGLTRLAVRQIRIWRCWCFANSLLSCEYGLPSQVPVDHRQITPADMTVLRPEFLAKLQIVLQIPRIHDVLGQSDDSEAPSPQLRTMRVLEKDLDVLCSPLRLSYLQWTPDVEFFQLLTLMDMYSACLSGLKPTMASPELQSSTARVASQMVELFSRAFSPAKDSPGMVDPFLTYHPKWYFKSAATAIFVLIKLVYLDRLPAEQIREIEQSVRTACASLMTYSTHEGDEYHRLVRVIEVLSRKGVIDSALATSLLNARFGASIHFEMLGTATQWRRRHGISNNCSTDPPPGAPLHDTSSSGRETELLTNPAEMTTMMFDDDYWATSVDFDVADMDLLGNSAWAYS